MTRYNVMPTGPQEAYDWKVEANGRKTSSHRTQENAVAAARERARPGDEVKVHVRERPSAEVVHGESMNVDVRLSPTGREVVDDVGSERAREHGERYYQVREAIENVLEVRTRRKRVKHVVKTSPRGRVGTVEALLGPSRRGSELSGGSLPGSLSTEKVPVGDVTSETTLDVGLEELCDELLEAVLDELDTEDGSA
ncbi:DUF2188 domain-containing protein [Halolamina salifodinae]|uniref:DUF2188 domain-containing protein n=1 Tax=Halolamina salifodinae TaxID=1202767 RepID=A0A8T4H0B2_9EURY|nr:DUF2188 domain-containing protein [Halolamina salifodinae]MBP1987224.1 hypothetical protein [Halolamina salifodinae]